MGKIKMNTDAVASVASNLMTINDSMTSEFDEAVSAVNSLDAAWNSPSKPGVIGKFREIQGSFNDARHTSLLNYANYLNQLIIPGYNQAEQANVSLADAFM